MKLKEAQKSSTEALKSLDDDLKIKNVNVHKTAQKATKIFDFWTPEDQFGAQICIAEALGIRC